jgi:hypothetical protein
MNRFLHISAALLCATVLAAAQGPVLEQFDTWTYSYEDITDFMRMYPGMYPLDYGTMGAPLVFRPWHVDPWTLEVQKDGIPQSRRYDGVFMANLQPVGELDTIRYDFLRGSGTGRFDLRTRNLPVDSPYTEFFIREGFYGYGTIDFAHGQRVYQNLTLELTGRLVWYNGFNLQQRDLFGATHEYRLRGRSGFDLGKKWRVEGTYAGANDKPELNYATELPSGLRFTNRLYEERSEGILAIAQKDSFRTAIDPRMTLFTRQDREQWRGSFRAREQMSGEIIQAHANLPRQRLTVEQRTTYSIMNFPGMPEARETVLELGARDSVNVGIGSVEPRGGIRWESLRLAATRTDKKLLMHGGFEFQSVPVKDFVIHGGSEYVEQTLPPAVRFGRYTVSNRPMLLAEAFDSLNATYDGTFASIITSADRYLKNAVGLRWQRNGAWLDAQVMFLHKPGNFENRLERTRQNIIYPTTVLRDSIDTQLGYYLGGTLPLWYGVSLQGWGFMQASSATPGTSEYQHVFSRLYFEHDYFTAPLTMRAFISYEYLGERTEFSDIGVATLPATNLVGFRVSGTIKGVTLMWGTENFLHTAYSLLPGYPRIGKEEYLEFIWRLWL